MVFLFPFPRLRGVDYLASLELERPSLAVSCSKRTTRGLRFAAANQSDQAEQARPEQRLGTRLRRSRQRFATAQRDVVEANVIVRAAEDH